MLPEPAARDAEDDPGELLEGVLGCGSCEAGYPVLAGVALLVPEQHHYLWAFWNDIESCTRDAGAEISRAMRKFLAIPGAVTGQAGPDDPWDEPLDWTTSPYLQWHFDNQSIAEGLTPGWWKEAVEGFAAGSMDPYRSLLEAARAHKTYDGLAVDVGTSVGRTAADLAGEFRFSIGVDWSFRSVLAARRYLLSQPSRMRSYPMESERGTLEERPLIPIEPANNLDFVVGDGAALPFGPGGAVCLAALNVVCAVPNPHQLLAEISRVCAPGGLLLLSTPYWPDSPAGTPLSPHALADPQDTRTALAPGFTVLEEEEMTPWLLRLARRRWNVYLCHCLVGRRR